MKIKCQLDHSYRPRDPADAQRAGYIKGSDIDEILLHQVGFFQFNGRSCQSIGQIVDLRVVSASEDNAVFAGCQPFG